MSYKANQKDPNRRALILLRRHSKENLPYNYAIVGEGYKKKMVKHSTLDMRAYKAALKQNPLLGIPPVSKREAIINARKKAQRDKAEKKMAQNTIVHKTQAR